MGPSLVGTQEVARTLGVSPQRIRQYAAAGRIPCRRTPGGHRRYDMGAVRAALASWDRLRNGPPRSRLLAAAAAAIREVEPGARVLLFGSRARGDARPDSDWDLAVIVEGTLTWQRKHAVWDRLNEVELEDESFPILTAVVYDQAGWQRRLEHPGLVSNIAREGLEV
jgi:uncharacterized protein